METTSGFFTNPAIQFQEKVEFGKNKKRGRY
jgi:hypothetical protein